MNTHSPLVSLPLALALTLSLMAADARAGEAGDYDVVVSPVLEVCLLGRSEYQFWKDALEGELLTPARTEGGDALLQICAQSTTYKDRPFEEATVVVFLAEGAEDTPLGDAYLVWGGSSVRSFAMVERMFYKAPYEWAQILRLNAEDRSAFTLAAGGDTFLRAAMGGEREPLRVEDALWEGTVYLPRHMTGAGRLGRTFDARLEGEVTVYPFLEDLDTVEVAPHDYPGLETFLSAGRFEPIEWRVRTEGVHSKGESVKR